MSEVEVGPPRPGDLGWLIGLHGRWYAENAGFSSQFEATVARIAADVASRVAPPRATMLVARDETGPLATLTADGDDPDEAGRGHIRIVIAEQVAKDIENYPGQAERHMAEIKLLLDRDEPDYAT